HRRILSGESDARESKRSQRTGANIYVSDSRRRQRQPRSANWNATRRGAEDCHLPHGREPGTTSAACGEQGRTGRASVCTLQSDAPESPASAPPLAANYCSVANSFRVHLNCRDWRPSETTPILDFLARGIGLRARWQCVRCPSCLQWNSSRVLRTAPVPHAEWPPNQTDQRIYFGCVDSGAESAGNFASRCF